MVTSWLRSAQHRKGHNSACRCVAHAYGCMTRSTLCSSSKCAGYHVKCMLPCTGSMADCDDQSASHNGMHALLALRKNVLNAPLKAMLKLGALSTVLQSQCILQGI